MVFVLIAAYLRRWNLKAEPMTELEMQVALKTLRGQALAEMMAKQKTDVPNYQTPNHICPNGGADRPPVRYRSRFT